MPVSVERSFERPVLGPGPVADGTSGNMLVKSIHLGISFQATPNPKRPNNKSSALLMFTPKTLHPSALTRLPPPPEKRELVRRLTLPSFELIEGRLYIPVILQLLRSFEASRLQAPALLGSRVQGSELWGRGALVLRLFRDTELSGCGA